MAIDLERVVLTVTCRNSIWCVEQGEQSFGHSADKEITRAAAMRRARELHDGGRACQILVHGEQLFRGRG